jgi:hypothetical protein
MDRESGGPTLVVGPSRHSEADIIQELQFLVLRYPAAAQAACRALVAEGRRFGKTAEGRAWRERLECSDLVRRGRVLWEATALDILEDRGDEILPSAFLDSLVGILSSDDFANLLAKVLREA